MKRFALFSFLILSSAVLAQTNIDSVLAANSALTFKAAIVDSVNISEMVSKQIEAARRKESYQYYSSNDFGKEEKLTVTEKKPAEQEVEKSSGPLSLFRFFARLPLDLMLFMLATAVIIFAVLLRRLKFGFLKKEKERLKNKIALLRQEKANVLAGKKNKSRGQLLKPKVLDKINEDNIDRLAKELEVGKGDLILASRIKLLELGQM